MCDFTDAEDRKLVQLASKYEKRGLKRSWLKIAKTMRGKSPAKLANRLKTLRNRYGRMVRDFPRWYFIQTRRPITNPRTKTLPPPQHTIHHVPSTADGPDHALLDDQDGQACNLLLQFNALLENDEFQASPPRQAPQRPIELTNSSDSTLLSGQDDQGCNFMEQFIALLESDSDG
jgi:hypothetical protein